MTEQEINKIIAEYMGYDSIDRYCKMNGDYYDAKKYTESLDACVPVVEKFFNDRMPMRDSWEFRLTRWDKDLKWFLAYTNEKCHMDQIESNLPSLALATALAKVIKEQEG